ncbi:MAG TPA: hypothetical protein VH165_25240 [Kofleriaceae bacterium]|nr:hypothetical protein [Kofleriaceae bacterium]
MTNSRPSSDPPSGGRPPRPRPAAKYVALAKARPDAAELHELLEANLAALRALHEEHQRMLQTSLQAIDGICTELRSELRAIGNARAPWVRAMSETRALLFIALREMVVGAHEAEMATQTPPPEPVEFPEPPEAEPSDWSSR